MKRYLRLYLYFVRFSFSRAMEFRLDFFFRIFMDIIYYIVNIAFYRIIFLHTSLLGGWNEEQLMVFIAGYLAIDALQMTLFSNNMWWLPIFINRGDLDYYLIRPVSSLFFLSLRDFAANSFVNLGFALGILIWAIRNYSAPVSAGQIAFFGLLLIMGTFMYYLVRMVMVIPVFWTHSARGFEQIFWNFTKFMERPDRIFTGWVRWILVTILPFSLMASYPARLFLEDFSPIIFGHLILVTLAFFGLVVFLWNKALRAYSSASS